MKVSDIMTKDVVTVKATTPLREAAGLLAKLRIHGMPVVDEDNKLEGIITESDFFTKDSSNIYLPTFLDFVRKEHTGDLDKKNQDDLERKTLVKDIMTRDCMKIVPDTAVEELIVMFKENGFNSLPVVDSDNTIMGIVTIMDVIRLL